MSNKEIISYTKQINIPAETQFFIVVRYYVPWGDGSQDGWQELVSAPSITMDGEPVELHLAFPQSESNYLNGSKGLGYDQRAQYYATASIPAADHERIMIINNQFFKMAYLSITLYQGRNPIVNIIDSGLEASNGQNPYIAGNPSVFSYDSPKIILQENIEPSNDNPLSALIKQKNELLKPPSAIKRANLRDGEIPIFKLDRESSSDVVGEEVSADGCSSSYLLSYPDVEKPFKVMRIKVPTTFIADDNPDLIFGDYQVRELSICSHISSETTNLLDYWSVSSRLLNMYKDEDGYAYVFFAPVDYVKQQIAEQGTPAKFPPTLTWGRYIGFLLGEPSFAMIMRYRANNPTWEGSPSNAPCYNTPEENQPLEPFVLGEYQPEFFGDTLTNFELGNLGAVNKDQPWPGYSKK